MTSILNMFSDNINNKIPKKVSPSLKQGKKFKKYQNKIENSLEINAENLSGKECFSNMNITNNGLTIKTTDIIKNNDYSSQQQIIDNLRREYENTLQEYKHLAASISGNATDYVNRVNPNNPYLNKVVKFTSGEVCYVTNQGVAKLITSTQIWQSLNIPQTVQMNLDIPWLSYTPGKQIPTEPPLITGTALEMGQSLGNEGTNVFVGELLPSGLNPNYVGCYAANSSNNNVSFIGGSPPPLDIAQIQNGNFSQPVLANDSFRYLTNSTEVPGWYFVGPQSALLNNSGAWGYPKPYPGGNQCVSIQSVSSIYQNIYFDNSMSYKLDLYACGRNCCTNPNYSNYININLYTTSNDYISTIGTLTPEVNVWSNYSFTFTVPTSQNYLLYFTGTASNIDRSTAISNVVLNSSNTSAGSYSHFDCKQAAISNDYRYFGLQNVNTSTGLGYCVVSNSKPAITQYGISQVPSKGVALWSSNTGGQPGNTTILSLTGTLQVINLSGTVVYTSTAPDTLLSNYLGCYNDGGSRVLPSFLGNNKTYDSCQKAAQNGSYKYFGLQYLQWNETDGYTSECWAGNNMSDAIQYGKASNCASINYRYVGGGNTNATYNTTLPESNYFLILQDDGNMVVYRGTNPNDNQGYIWGTQTNGQQQQANPQMVASKGKYGKNWMPSGSTLAPGDFIGSIDGKMALVMQTDGNLVLYTYQMETNCQKMSDGNLGGGVGANAFYDIGETAVKKNMGILGFIDDDSNLYTYPSSNQQFSTDYSVINGVDSGGNDIPGAAFSNATVDSCSKACNKNNDCAGFVIDVNGNYGNSCWPKTNKMFPYGGYIGPNKNLDLYIRNKQPVSPPISVPSTTKSIDSVKYQNYINKGTIGSQYGLANATSSQKQQLEQLESRMSLLSNQIIDLTNKFEGGTLKADNQSTENNSGITKYLDYIKNTNKKIGLVARETKGNIHNILSDSDIIVLQKNYDYLFWSILAAGTVLVSMNIIQK
jgi:hypothetical protein